MSRNNAGLSTDRIIDEALRIIDGQGLRRLTMRRLGDALEVEAMAVYHHFPLGKEQLFDAIAAALVDLDRAERADAPLPGDDAGAESADGDEEDTRPPGERLRDWAHRYRAALLRHSGALQLLINRRPDTEPARRSAELVHAAFAEAGLTGPALTAAAAALDSYVTGAAIRQVRASGLPAPVPAALDGRFPTLSALPDTPEDHDRLFAEGLDALLAGLAAPR